MTFGECWEILKFLSLITILSLLEMSLLVLLLVMRMRSVVVED